MFTQIIDILPKLFDILPSINSDGKNQWIFPKGRIDYQYNFDNKNNILVQESPLECALREFTEETGGLIADKDWSIFENPIDETYIGSNSKNYTSRYFVLECPEKLHVIKKINSNENNSNDINIDNSEINSNENINDINLNNSEINFNVNINDNVNTNYDNINNSKWVHVSELPKYFINRKMDIINFINENITGEVNYIPVNEIWTLIHNDTENFM